MGSGAGAKMSESVTVQGGGGSEVIEHSRKVRKNVGFTPDGAVKRKQEPYCESVRRCGDEKKRVTG